MTYKITFGQNRVRGTENRIPAQVTKGLVNWNFVALILSKNVHPTQAELRDGAGAPGYKHILQLAPQAVFEAVQIGCCCSTAPLLTGFTKT